MQTVARASWLRRGEPRLVLEMSRVFGVAPLAFESNRVRTSRPLWIYGMLLTITISMNVVTAVLALGRIECWIEIVDRVHMVKTDLGDLHDVEKIKKNKPGLVTLYFVAFLIVYCVQICLTVYRTVAEPLHVVVFFLTTVTTEFISSMAITLTTLQFVLMFWYISSVFVSFNNKLRLLLHSVDKRDETGADSEIEFDLITDNATSQIGSMGPMDITTDTLERPADIMNSSKSAELTLRQLNVIYIEIYDLVAAMNHNHSGIPVLLILVSITFGIISSLYSIFKEILDKSIRMSNLVLELIWLCHHFVGIVWLMNPGHHIIYEVIKIKHTTRKLMGIASFCSKEFVEELNKFYTKLVLMKPTFSPLGVCTLSRSLIVTIVGAAVTYMVVAVQFLTTELSSNSTNNTTHN